jgi:hypothetical protein
MKPRIINRHDSIKTFISTKIAHQKGIKVIEEKSIATPNGTLKPDLIVIDQQWVHVVDVTIRHEDVGYLQQGYNEKISKYTPLLPLLAEEHKLNPGRVLPVVIGARGAIPKSTIESLEVLGITDYGSLITLALMSLRSSIEIYHAFLDYNRVGIG